MRVLTVNAGSTSLKLSVLDGDDQVVVERTIPRSPTAADPEEVRALLAASGGVDAVGHRVVHGGPRHTTATRLTPAVRADLAGLIELAPLHQRPALEAINLLRRIDPRVPEVACFDTTFHATLPAAASTYALPARWRTRYGLRRYGFHGLSHAYASARAVQLAGLGATARVVTAHLGGGCSLAAVAGGRSVDTTMGFTPVEGLVMASRSGSVDPGMLFWLLRHGASLAEVAETLERRSGLLGLVGTGDMREVLERQAAGDPAAELGLGVYVHRLRGGVAAMAAAMGGMDALVFTGGVGEHAAPVRARVVDGLGFLGLRLDPAANAAAEPDADVGARGAAVRTLVVRAREDLRIAAEVRAVLTGSGPTSHDGTDR